jgi:hypothetical protein
MGNRPHIFFAPGKKINTVGNSRYFHLTRDRVGNCRYSGYAAVPQIKEVEIDG